MKYAIIISVAALLAGCLPGQEPNQILVEGEATIKVMPDRFDVSASIESRGATHSEVLSGIATVYAEIKEQLPQLEGLDEITISTSQVNISPRYDYKCQEERYEESECPIIGYRGVIGIGVEGTPTNVAGSILSLMSELGASSVQLDAFRVSDISEHQKKAMRAAVENAREKAELIAAAAGSTVTGAIKIQTGREFDQYYFDREDDTIIVTGSRLVRPQIPLDIGPQPVRVNAEVVAAFEIE